MTQSAQERCECGAFMRFTETRSPWEFEGTCDGCKAAILRSYAHASPPPVFAGVVNSPQLSLF